MEISSGIYFETVKLHKSGTPEAPIHFRPVENGWVQINAGRPLNLPLKPAPGLPEVYVAEVGPDDFPAEGAGIWEVPSRLRLARAASAQETARRLGSWFFDASARRLYLRSTGSASASQTGLWLEQAKAPAIHISASHIRISGLETTLGEHGIFVAAKTSHVVIEDCRAYCNVEAGLHVTGDHHRLLRSETTFNNGYGIQLRHGVNHILVEGNHCLFNGPNNGEVTATSVPTDLGIYGKGGYNRFVGNIVDGLHEDVYRNKTGHGHNQLTLFHNNVVRGNFTTGPFGIYQNTFLVSGLGMRAGMYRNGGKPNPMRTWEKVDPLGLQRKWNLIHPLVQKDDPKFADPTYRDFRLQADTPYPGQGAYPGPLPVFFIDPTNGNDTHSGLSVADAFATPAAALERAVTGATLYFLPGRYDAPVEIAIGGINAQAPFTLRAWGRQGGVLLAGGLKITGAPHVVVDGVELPNARVEADASPGLILRNTLFSGTGSGLVLTNGSRAVRVENATFSESATAVRVEKSPHLSLTATLFSGCPLVLEADAASAPTLASDFNAFSRFAARLGGKESTFADWKATTANDSHSREAAIHLGPGGLTPVEPAFTHGALGFGPLGARQPSPATLLEVANLRVAGLDPHGATLLWETPRQATFCEISLHSEDGTLLRKWEPAFLLRLFGESFDVTHVEEAFYASERHAALGRLEPDTGYRVSLVSLDRTGQRGAPATLTFRTPAQPAKAATRYVSPTGSDLGDGTTPKTAWASFSHAFAQVNPGDEVVLLPGVYREILRPRVAGVKERPLRIRAAKAWEAALTPNQGVPVAIEILNTGHLEISGLKFDGAGGHFGTFCTVNNAPGITLRDCEFAYPTGGTFEKLKLGYNGLIADEAPGLRVENNLFIGAGVHVALSNSPGSIVRSNTFVGHGNYGVVILAGGEAESYTVVDNLFERTTFNYKTNPSLWVFDPMPQLTSDHNLFHILEKDKGTVGKLPSTERLGPLEAWQKATGFDKASLYGKPLFANPQEGDFALAPGSPGKGAASDGGDIGYRKRE